MAFGKSGIWTCTDSPETPDAKAWLQERVRSEVSRIKEGGARAVPLQVKNCGVLVEHDDISPSGTKNPRRKRVKVVNRIEIGSGMDFKAIQQIMVSEPVDYPFRTGYLYVHVLAFTSSSSGIALLLPYVYAPYLKKGPVSTTMLDSAAAGEEVEEEVISARKTDKDSFENTLREWLLINEKYGRARHSVQEFHAIA